MQNPTSKEVGALCSAEGPLINQESIDLTLNSSIADLTTRQGYVGAGTYIRITPKEKWRIDTVSSLLLAA
jgi:hypothetical protein